MNIEKAGNEKIKYEEFFFFFFLGPGVGEKENKWQESSVQPYDTER